MKMGARLVLTHLGSGAKNVEHGATWREVALLLGQHPSANTRSHLHRAGIRHIPGDAAEQCRLAGPVFAEQRDAITSPQRERHAVQHLLPSVPGPHVVRFYHKAVVTDGVSIQIDEVQSPAGERLLDLFATIHLTLQPTLP